MKIAQLFNSCFGNTT